MDNSKISDDIIRNAVELQSLQLLQNTSESLRDDRLSNSLFKNLVMKKWLEEPSNSDYLKILAKLSEEDLKEAAKQGYKYALGLVRPDKDKKEESADKAEEDC